MEFLNGGDLMYHIQDKGRFELYRAMYVRALLGAGEPAAGMSSTPPFPSLENPGLQLGLERFGVARAASTVWGAWAVGKLWPGAQHGHAGSCPLPGSQPLQPHILHSIEPWCVTPRLPCTPTPNCVCVCVCVCININTYTYS